LQLAFVVPYTPNLIRTRPYNLLRQLAKRGHEIMLATLWSSEMERAAIAELSSGGIRVLAARLPRARSLWNCLRTLPRPTPLQSVYCWQPQLLKTMQSALEAAQPRFDLIHVEHLRGARYGTHLNAILASTPYLPPIVWDSVDCISYLFEQARQGGRNIFGRLVTGLELPRTRWYEAWLAGQFARVLVTSEQDRRAFGELLQEFAYPANGHLTGANNLRVLPNGVDLDYFVPCRVPRALQTLVLSGKMSYHANVAAALYLLDEVMPWVWQKYPAARVQIIGQDPPAQISNRARRDPERIFVSGTVRDVRPYLAEATLAIAPITYGAGIQNKVLEGMAMGTPVVATSRAVSALAVQNERQVLIGDDPIVLSQQVMRLLRNPGLRERLGANGRRYVEAYHDWNRIAEQLERIYQEVIIEGSSAK
jgi:glycosyltransferase involved in cell wall biosynthesis